MQPNKTPITVVIADNSSTSRFDMKKVLSSKNPDIVVIGEAENGFLLLSLIETITPDIVLMDVSMPVIDGLTVLKKIRRIYPVVKVIMVFDDNDSLDTGKKAMELGASSCIKKSYESEQVIKAIMDVLREGFHSNDFINELAMSVVQQLRVNNSALVTTELTNKEKAILTLMSEEKSTKEIASILNLSPRTIEAMRDTLKTKTGTKSVAGLIIFAIKNGLTEIQPEVV